MKKIIQRLQATPEQHARLQALQKAFAEVCNALGPVVRDTRCWNRVALHHLTYKGLRERYPNLGSQLVCNAIYSVSRSARVVYQHPASPWCVDKRPVANLPLLQFADSAPVYFDRHTLSLRKGRLSMFTLDGRIQFDVHLSKGEEASFLQEKIKEIALSCDQQGYVLTFMFGEGEQASPDLPEYLLVVEDSSQPVAQAA